MRCIIFVTVLLLCPLVGTFGQTQEEALFVITRNKDANRIIYHLNADPSGKLDLNQPIGAYWVRETEEGSRSQSLSMLERRYAYGLKFLEVKPHFAKFRFVSYSKRDFILKRNGRGKYEVFAMIAGEQAKLDELHLHLDGGTFWFPRISFIRIEGEDGSGRPVKEVVSDLQ